MAVKTVLIIDADRNATELARLALEAEGVDVMTVFTGQSGLEIAERHAPDVVVVDMGLPDMDGLQICRQLRESPTTAAMPIIMLAKDESERVAALEAGADDSLARPVLAHELAIRVKALIRRATMHDGTLAVLERGDLKMDTATHCVLYEGHAIELTATEFRILLYLAGHPEKVYSREDIIRNVRDEDAAVLDRSIDVHILSLRRKLQGGKEIKTVRGFGYKFSLAA